MSNPWNLYDRLIECIPDNITVLYCGSGHNWTIVTSSEHSVGLSMTIPLFTKPFVETRRLEGLPLKEVAKLSKSWNFVEASIGVAAINSYYNQENRCKNEYPRLYESNCTAFDYYKEELSGKKVAVIGHFPNLEKNLNEICDLSILERIPIFGDYPDSACEYILPEQDFIFITGCTLVNKTLPRLLELGRHSKVILVGPSVPMTPMLSEFNVYGLSGLIVHNEELSQILLREGNKIDLFSIGNMVNVLA